MTDPAMPPEQQKHHPFFELVKPEGNWKNPISARVPLAKLKEMGGTRKDIEDAVIFFAGCLPEIFPDPKDPAFLVVEAPGYYMSVGS